jgi:hypothetical protein
MGVAGPLLIVALIVASQMLGGVVGLRLARRALERIASVAPAWTRS